MLLDSVPDLTPPKKVIKVGIKWHKWPKMDVKGMFFVFFSGF